ncbi:hypothetical protein MKW98_000698 [Papaver atlanticum]|uniref:Uncharacterized protein n=1 Tax=Papaver atlanticum TaxID=357466 RepID=A0AAD4S0W2_9MAGN|nr:hypothetical protein MKW98_000698 [Papaver atlanticum]
MNTQQLYHTTRFSPTHLNTYVSLLYSISNSTKSNSQQRHTTYLPNPSLFSLSLTHLNCFLLVGGNIEFDFRL